MKNRDPRDCERWEGKYRVDADDVMLCLDAATGRTLWRTMFAGKGINFALTRSGPFMTPLAD
jgi:outer membrane protein assembly factor BamB